MNERYAWQRMRARHILEMLENINPDEIGDTLEIIDQELMPVLDELTSVWPDIHPVRRAIVSRNYDSWLRSKDL